MEGLILKKMNVFKGKKRQHTSAAAVSLSPTSHLILVGNFNVDVSTGRSPQMSNLQYFCDSFDIENRANIENRVSEITRLVANGSQTTIDFVLAGDGLVKFCKVIPSTIKADLLDSDLENFTTAQIVDSMWST